MKIGQFCLREQELAGVLEILGTGGLHLHVLGPEGQPADPQKRGKHKLSILAPGLGREDFRRPDLVPMTEERHAV